MPTVIDSLIVTLGLDPKKYGAGIADAEKKREVFTKGIKALGVEEDKLDAKQKKVVSTLRDMAVTAERGGKEIKAVGEKGSEAFALLEKGAIGFGAALGLYSVAEYAKNALTMGTNLTFVARQLGFSTTELDTWGKAVEAAGGSVDDAQQSLTNFKQELIGLQNFSDPKLQTLRAMIFRYTGKQVAFDDASGKHLPLANVMGQLADAAKTMGPEKAFNLFSQYGFTPGFINFLEQGSGGVASGLAAAGKVALDPGGAEDLKKLDTTVRELNQAFTSLKNTLLIDFAPTFTAIVKNLRLLVLKWSGKITQEEFDKQTAENDDALHGAGWTQHQKAENITKQMFGSAAPSSSTGLGSFPKTKYGKSIPDGYWTREQITKRAEQLLSQGKAEADIPGIISGEINAGKAPPSLGVYGPTLPASQSSARGVRDNNPLDIMFAHQAGATGDTYVGADGVTRTLAHFGSMADGLEAARRLLRVYFGKGLNTISGIESTWAPAKDGNDVPGNIRKLAGFTGFGANQTLSNTPDTIERLLGGMARLETGYSVAGAGGGGDITVTGPITIHAPARDGESIKGALKSGIQNRAHVAQANTGVSG